MFIIYYMNKSNVIYNMSKLKSNDSFSHDNALMTE